MVSIADSQILDDIIRREGGFVDRPEDKGGPTKYGITQQTLSEWLGREASREDIEKLPVGVARNIYRELYIERPRFDGIRNDRLRALIIDCGVNHGVRRATRWLQREVGVVPDGVVGPKTLAAVNAYADQDRLYRRILARRARFYGRIITRRPSQAVFAAGWMNRLAEFIIS